MSPESRGVLDSDDRLELHFYQCCEPPISAMRGNVRELEHELSAVVGDSEADEAPLHIIVTGCRAAGSQTL
jgi:hypothetical protein